MKTVHHCLNVMPKNTKLSHLNRKACLNETILTGSILTAVYHVNHITEILDPGEPLELESNTINMFPLPSYFEGYVQM